MASLFPRWTNTVARSSALLLLSAPVGALALLMVYQRTPFITGQGEAIVQPIQFDHRHHVVDEGIDCRFCHASVETSATAGVPPVSLCMGCHAQVWNKSPFLAPVRAAYFEDKPIAWNR